MLEIAACLVLALGIAVPGAIASNSSVRVQVMKLLISLDDGHVDVGMTEDEEASFDIPAEWVGNYYPCYIPESYELVDVGTIVPSLDYLDNNGNYVYFYECTSAVSFGVNSEGSEITYEDINGFEAMVISDEFVTSITWSDGTTMFLIEGTAGKDEVMKVAKNVRRIK